MVRFGIAAKGVAALFLLTSLASTETLAATKPNGLNFAVTVTKNGGAPFNDCFSFGVDGRLKVTGPKRYGVLEYVDDTYGTDMTWLSIAPPSFVAWFGAGLAFTGEVNSSGNLVATGLSSPNYIYTIAGTPTTSCTTTASAGPGGWTTRP